MRNTILTVVSIVVFSLCGAPSAHADLRVKSTYIAGGQANETTVYSKGARQRFEPGMGMAIINQNDVNRIVQLFADKKMYLIMSPEMMSGALPGGQPQAAAPSSTAKGGGIVNVVIAITDTGERKQMFGYTARHVKNTLTMNAGADACNPGSETIETDGWYTDYTPEPATAPSPSPAPAQTPAAPTACKDDVRVEHTGTGALGYPLAYKLKTTKDGKTTELGMEVVEFSAAELDSGLFEVPAGYTELKGFAGLGAMFAGAAAPASPAGPGADRAAAGQPRVASTGTGFVTPKAAGAIRVGVADVGNRAGRNLGAASPRDQLVAELLKARVDAVPLAGLSVAEVEAVSKTLECDYILFTEVIEVKKAGGGLGGLGSMLNKASAITGGGAPKEKLEARVEYRLAPIDGSKPLVSSTAKGTNGGGFGVTSAFGLAMNVTTFGMFSRMGMFDPNMMRVFGSMGGGMGGAGMGGNGMSALMGVPGMPRGGVDPGLSPFIAAMSATQTAMAPPEPTEDGKAVADAFADAAKKVSEALLKKR